MDRILQYANIEKKELRTNSSCVGSKFQIEVVYDNVIIGVGSDLDEKKAKEIASLKACEYLQIWKYLYQIKHIKIYIYMKMILLSLYNISKWEWKLA